MPITDDLQYTLVMVVIGAAFVLFGLALLQLAYGYPKWIRRAYDWIARAVREDRRRRRTVGRHRPPLQRAVPS